MWVARDALRIQRLARAARRVPDEFDAAHGVRTWVVPTLAERYQRTRAGGFEHEPSSPAPFREVLDTLDIDFKETVFVDLGSGAGRAVLMALEYPFKEVVGVELSASLHARADANVRAYPAAARRAGAVRLVCGDVTGYELPPDPLVLYLYNPFGVGVMRRVRRTIEASLTRRPRPMTIILAFCYREPREVMEASPLLRVVTVDRGITTLTPALARSTA